MESEILKSLDIHNISDKNKEELLELFMITDNSRIRNQIALIFSDIRYNEAIPCIIKKINEKELYNFSGTLVFALQGLEVQQYFIDIVNILCNQDYEARLMAYDIIEDYSKKITPTQKNEALSLLEKEKIKVGEVNDEDYTNSKLHFIESSIKLLQYKVSPAGGDLEGA